MFDFHQSQLLFISSGLPSELQTPRPRGQPQAARPWSHRRARCHAVGHWQAAGSKLRWRWRCRWLNFTWSLCKKMGPEGPITVTSELVAHILYHLVSVLMCFRCDDQTGSLFKARIAKHSWHEMSR